MDSSNIFVAYLQLDDKAHVIKNPVTGQSLKFDEVFTAAQDVAGPTMRRWMRFTYSDRDGTYPVLVECVVYPGASGAIWFLDYDRSQLDQVSYGLWLRIDRFAIDALEYFSHSQILTRPAAFEIAARGGWYPEWNPKILRTQKCPQLVGPALVKPEITSAYLPPLDHPSPCSWHLVPAGEISEHNPVLKLWENAALKGQFAEEAYFTVIDLISRFPVFMDSSEKRMLMRAPASVSGEEDDHKTPVFDPIQIPAKRKQTYLYLDENCLLHPIQIERAQEDTHLDLTISCSKYPGPNGIGLAYLSDRSASGEIKQADNPRSFHQQNSLDPPEWVENRVRDACFSVISAMTPNATIDRPLPALQIDYSVGSFPEGHERKVLFSNTSFIKTREHAGATGTQTPETSRVMSGARQSNNCWSFDPESTSLRNGKTGQSLTLSSIVDVPRSKLPLFLENPVWWQLTYEDAKTRYSLPVARGAESASASMFVPFLLNRPSSYGLWRRLLLAISDGLSCWPDRNSFKGSTGGVRCLGGWANGKWHKNQLTDSFGGAVSLDLAAADDTTLPDLSAKPPSAWEFIDASEARGDAWISGLTWESPAGTTTNNEVRYFAASPLTLTGQRADPISGFQGKTPYLRRKDGSAVFFPARVISVTASDLRGEFPLRATRIVCVYADQDFTAVFLQRTMERMTFDIQDASLNPKNRFNTYSQYQERGPYRGEHAFRVPDWPQWLSLQEKLMDVGLAWEGSYVQLAKDAARPGSSAFDANKSNFQSLEQCNHTTIKGRYCNGVFQPDANQYISLLGKGKLR